MISEDRVKGSYGIGVGMLMGIAIQWLWMSHLPQLAHILLLAIATVIFTTGCVFYSRSKGFGPYLGLIGVFWIPGLVILILLPDRTDTSFKEVQTQFEARRKKGSFD